jgi:hypothetical protein
MATASLKTSPPLPTWRRLPMDRRRRLAVLVGQLAWRQLHPERASLPTVPNEEDADGPCYADRQDQGTPP